MSKFLNCTYCADSYFWTETHKCERYVYYDYLEDSFFISTMRKRDWAYHCGDYNLVYLGVL